MREFYRLTIFAVSLMYLLLVSHGLGSTVLAQQAACLAQNNCPGSFGDDYCMGSSPCSNSGCASNVCPAACGEVASGTYGTVAGSCGTRAVWTPASGVAPYVTPGFCTTSTVGSWCEQWQYCCTICGPGDCGTPGGGGGGGGGGGSGCTESGWTNQGCGAGTCAADEMYQTQTVSPAACAATQRCITTAACTDFSTASACNFTVADQTLFGTGSTAVVQLSGPPVPFASGSPINYVSFTTFNNGIASVTSPDYSPAPYLTTVTANGIGNTQVLVRMVLQDGTTCQKPFNVSVTNPPPWFQTIDGDITSGNGNINNPIPVTCVAPGCLPYMNLDPPGNSPGVGVARGNINNAPGGTVSQPPALRVQNSPYRGTTVYDYDFYFNKINSPIYNAPVPGDGVIDQLDVDAFIAASPPINGGWHVVQLPCTAGTVNSGNFDMLNNRTILFIDCDLNITGPIHVNNGRGNLVVVVRDDIKVDPSVGNTTPDIEGNYNCDNTFFTGPGNKKLHIRGAVKCNDIEIERNLDDNSQEPAVVFEYGIDQNVMFPTVLGGQNIIWREVAP